MRSPRLFAILALSLALLLALSGCSWLEDLGNKLAPSTDAMTNTVALVKAGLTPAVTAEVAYLRQPTCGKTIVPFCKELSVVKKLKNLRIAAYTAVDMADQAVHSAKTATEKAKAQDLIGAAQSAASSFQTIAEIFNPQPKVTTDAD